MIHTSHIHGQSMSLHILMMMLDGLRLLMLTSMDLTRTSSSQMSKSSWALSLTLCWPTLKENSQNVRSRFSRNGGTYKMKPKEIKLDNLSKMSSLNSSTLGGLCMTRLVQSTKTWSTTWWRDNNGSQTLSEWLLELDGNSIHSVTQIPMQDYSMTWVLKPCSLEDMTA